MGTGIVMGVIDVSTDHARKLALIEDDGKFDKDDLAAMPTMESCDDNFGSEIQAFIQTRHEFLQRRANVLNEPQGWNNPVHVISSTSLKKLIKNKAESNNNKPSSELGEVAQKVLS